MPRVGRGDAVGSPETIRIVGASVTGEVVGLPGVGVGFCVGVTVGTAVCSSVGDSVTGEAVGEPGVGVGFGVAATVGPPVGLAVGSEVTGDLVGEPGAGTGAAVDGPTVSGSLDPGVVGNLVGVLVGDDVGPVFDEKYERKGTEVGKKYVRGPEVTSWQCEASLTDSASKGTHEEARTSEFH